MRWLARIGLIALALTFVSSLIVRPAAARDPTGGNRPQSQARQAANSEMTRIFEADQADRDNPATIDWAAVGKRDDERRGKTKALLDAGLLKSGDDFWHAAFVFQHGEKPEDFLVAHTLAIIAADRGRRDATWIAAATLDRYLQAVGQKQVYGTQYVNRDGKPTTQEPYDRTTISDALRSAMDVPVLADQEKKRVEIEAKFRHSH
jgi:hypothetical protein